MNDTKGELIVTAIENGTVLDHIPAENLFKVIDILGLKRSGNEITIGFNLASRSLGRKGLIKVSGRFFENEEISKIALVAPNATINVIRNFKVVEKKIIDIPKEVVGIVRCSNPVCVTNHQPVTTRFRTVTDNGATHLLCHYCEKATALDSIEIISL